MKRRHTNSDDADTYSDLLYSTPAGAGNNNCYSWAVEAYSNARGGRKLQPGDLSGVGSLAANGSGNTPSNGVDIGRCEDVLAKTERDAAAQRHWVRRVDASASVACPRGSSKIMAFLDPGNDYHWYRFHRNLLYRVRHPRTVAELAAEFGVRPEDVHAPGTSSSSKTRLAKGDMVLIRGAAVWSHKRGHSPEGPLLKDACGKIIKDPRTACRDYGTGTNYTTPCGALCYSKKTPTYTDLLKKKSNNNQ